MSSRKRDELEQRRERLARNEQLARTGPPRARFAYAAAATKQRARIARLERELESEQPQRAPLVFMARSRAGSRWHLVPNPGTAFPVGACGSYVEWGSLRQYEPREFRADRFRGSQLCKRCSRTIEREDS